MKKSLRGTQGLQQGSENTQKIGQKTRKARA